MTCSEIFYVAESLSKEIDIYHKTPLAAANELAQCDGLQFLELTDTKDIDIEAYEWTTDPPESVDGFQCVGFGAPYQPGQRWMRRRPDKDCVVAIRLVATAKKKVKS